jgi:uncharacterized Zn finger protein (UPF0148 family)
MPERDTCIKCGELLDEDEGETVICTACEDSVGNDEEDKIPPRFKQVPY